MRTKNYTNLNGTKKQWLRRAKGLHSMIVGSMKEIQ
jgi:hypothetical protein